MARAAKKSTKEGASPLLLHVTDVFPEPVIPYLDDGVTRTTFDASPFDGDGDVVHAKTWLDAAAERGTVIHKACEYYDRAPDKPVRVREDIRPYVLAWVNFVAEMQPVITEIEKVVGGIEFGFIGRLDRELQISRHHWVIDIKSGAKRPTHGPQLAAYAFAAHPKDFGKIRRAAVHLKPNKTYEFIEYTDPHDLQVFLAYLKIAYWEIAHGIRPKPKRRDYDVELR